MFLGKKVWAVDQILPEYRAYLHEKQGGRCQYCGVELTEPEKTPVDFIQPKNRGGAIESENNHRICCRTCNMSKRGRTVEEYRMAICIKNSPFDGELNFKQLKKFLDMGATFPIDLNHKFYFEREQP